MWTELQKFHALTKEFTQFLEPVQIEFLLQFFVYPRRGGGLPQEVLC